MSKNQKDPNFYARMQEFKRLKRIAMAQKRIADEFGDPSQPHSLSDSDLALNRLREKLLSEQQPQKPQQPQEAPNKVQQALDKLRQQANGL